MYIKIYSENYLLLCIGILTGWNDGRVGPHSQIHYGQEYEKQRGARQHRKRHETVLQDAVLVGLVVVGGLPAPAGPETKHTHAFSSQLCILYYKTIDLHLVILKCNVSIKKIKQSITRVDGI